MGELKFDPETAPVHDLVIRMYRLQGEIDGDRRLWKDVFDAVNSEKISELRLLKDTIIHRQTMAAMTGRLA